MYSTPWCGDCRRAKRLFDENSIPYVEINIDEAEEAARKVLHWSGGRRVVPTFDIDGDIHHNPPIAVLKEILQISTGTA